MIQISGRTKSPDPESIDKIEIDVRFIFGFEMLRLENSLKQARINFQAPYFSVFH